MSMSWRREEKGKSKVKQLLYINHLTGNTSSLLLHIGWIAIVQNLES